MAEHQRFDLPVRIPSFPYLPLQWPYPGLPRLIPHQPNSNVLTLHNTLVQDSYRPTNCISKAASHLPIHYRPPGMHPQMSGFSSRIPPTHAYRPYDCHRPSSFVPRHPVRVPDRIVQRPFVSHQNQVRGHMHRPPLPVYRPRRSYRITTTPAKIHDMRKGSVPSDTTESQNVAFKTSGGSMISTQILNSVYKKYSNEFRDTSYDIDYFRRVFSTPHMTLEDYIETKAPETLIAAIKSYIDFLVFENFQRVSPLEEVDEDTPSPLTWADLMREDYIREAPTSTPSRKFIGWLRLFGLAVNHDPDTKEDRLWPLRATSTPKKSAANLEAVQSFVKSTADINGNHLTGAYSSDDNVVISQSVPVESRATRTDNQLNQFNIKFVSGRVPSSTSSVMPNIKIVQHNETAESTQALVQYLAKMDKQGLSFLHGDLSTNSTLLHSFEREFLHGPESFRDPRSLPSETYDNTFNACSLASRQNVLAEPDSTSRFEVTALLTQTESNTRLPPIASLAKTYLDLDSRDVASANEDTVTSSQSPHENSEVVTSSGTDYSADLQTADVYETTEGCAGSGEYISLGNSDPGEYTSLGSSVPGEFTSLESREHTEFTSLAPLDPSTFQGSLEALQPHPGEECERTDPGVDVQTTAGLVSRVKRRLIEEFSPVNSEFEL